MNGPIVGRSSHPTQTSPHWLSSLLDIFKTDSTTQSTIPTTISPIVSQQSYSPSSYLYVSIVLLVLASFILYNWKLLLYFARFFYIKFRTYLLIRNSHTIVDVFLANLSPTSTSTFSNIFPFSLFPSSSSSSSSSPSTSPLSPGERAAIIFDKIPYSFIDLDRFSNRIANWAIEARLGGPHTTSPTITHASSDSNNNNSSNTKPSKAINSKSSNTSNSNSINGIDSSSTPVTTPTENGRVVALLMESRPEFVGIWLGLAKVGYQIALINCTMTGQSLVQAMKECGASTLLYGDECRKQAEDILRGFHPHQQQITDNKSSSSSSTASSSSSTTTNTNDVVISIGSLKASASSSPSQLRLFRVPDARFASSSPKNDNFNLSKASTLPPLLPTAHCLAYLLPESSDSLSLSSSSSSSSSTSASRPLSSSLPPSPIYRSHCHPHSPLFYIFTSGTTGLPKAAKVTHCRVFLAGITFSIMNGVNSSDIIYCPLPLYHSAAGLLGLGMSWCVGCSILIKRKFSASSFFRDCYENNVTTIQYIGQLCRYLLSTPPSPYDTRHSITKAIGNGMREDVWRQFITRFRIPYVGEFYGSTEGNATLVNTMNHIGACGYMPHVTTLVYPISIIKIDDSGEPIRDKNGYCIQADYNEPGELLGKITSDPIRQWSGYTNDKESQKKVLYNVYRKGDMWFRSGDLLRRDTSGYIYFIDRLGDTYRWKGENCACSQVEVTLRKAIDDRSIYTPFTSPSPSPSPSPKSSGQYNSKSEGNTFDPPLNDVAVYGVPVPGYDGKAGMACIVLSSSGTALLSSLSSSTTSSESSLETEGVVSSSTLTLSPTLSSASSSSSIMSPASSLGSHDDDTQISISIHHHNSAVTGHKSTKDLLLEQAAAFPAPFPTSLSLASLKSSEPMSKHVGDKLSKGPSILVDWQRFYSVIAKDLATWQMPLFIRLSAAVDTTSTFKHNKTRLTKEGFDPDAVGLDTLLLRLDIQKSFIPLTKDVYSDIVSGKIRL